MHAFCLGACASGRGNKVNHFQPKNPMEVKQLTPVTTDKETVTYTFDSKAQVEVEKPTTVLPATRTELRRLIAHGTNLGWKRSLTEVIADLSKPIPYELISWKPIFKKGKRDGEVPFISWTDCVLILEFITPGWTVTVRENQLGDRAVVSATITLLCAEGRFSRSSIGSENLEDENFGGPLPDAESQSFRRACTRFGLGLYLYDKKVVEYLTNYRNKIGR